MTETLASFSRSLLDTIIPLYKNTDFAYALATLMILVAIVAVVVASVVHLVRRSALSRRINAIRGNMSFVSSDAVEASEATPSEIMFHKQVEEIDEVLGAQGLFVNDIGRAWHRFRDSLRAARTPPVRTLKSPRAYYFEHVQPPSWLDFLANTFVAFGLLATFLGLVAALTFAADGLQTDDTAAMMAALRDLLAASASKFVTSVAGVGLALVVRLFERAFTDDLRGQLGELCVALETGVRVETSDNQVLIEEIQRLSEKLTRVTTKTVAE